MTTENAALTKIRKLLAKAEAQGVTPAEAQAFTAKAAELMARYGIDRALLAATSPETDRPADRIITVTNPWAAVCANLLCGIGAAMRCQCICLTGRSPGAKVHIFGYASDIERAEVLYTSVLLQMQHGLVRVQVPEWASSPRAWRRSWLLGYATAVTARVRSAEKQAASRADTEQAAPGTSTALVLASRERVIAVRTRAVYPVTRRSRVTYSGSGYRDGYRKGTQADLGGNPITGRAQASLH